MKLALLVLLAALALPAAAQARPAAVPGAAEVQALLKGVPQQGGWLGRASAPVVLVEYVDLQCPYCAIFSRQTLPPLVRSYVRSGKVRVLFRGLAFLGPDSVTALRWTYGAAAQNRLWNVLELLFVNQGTENAGWVKQSLLDSVARSVRGLDLARLRRDAARTGMQIDTAAAAAKAAKVPGTPFVQIGRSLGALQTVKLKSFDSRDIAARIDALLKK